MPSQNPPPRASDDSIKARKNLYFEEKAKAEADAPVTRVVRKPFSVILRDTPPAPLPSRTKLILWVVGLLIAALLAFTLMSRQGGHRKGARGKLRRPVAAAPATPIESRPASRPLRS